MLQQNIRASFFQISPRTRQARNEEDESVTFSTFRDWDSLCESHHQRRMQLLLLKQAWTYKDSVGAKCYKSINDICRIYCRGVVSSYAVMFDSYRWC